MKNQSIFESLRLNWLFYLILVFQSVLFLRFSFLYSPYLATSDATTGVVLAREILIEKSLFPGTWFYVNGEIWALNTHLLSLPFVNLIRNQKVVFILSVVFGYFLVFISTNYFFKTLRAVSVMRLGFLVLLMSGVSATLADLFFIDRTYGVFLVFYILAGGMTVSLMRRGIVLVSAITLLGIMIASSIHGVRGLMLFSGPLLVGLFSSNFLVKKPTSSSLVKISSIILVGAAVGLLLHLRLRQSLHVQVGLETVHTLPTVEDIVGNMRMLILGALDLFGAGDFAQESIKSLAFPLTVARLIILGFISAASLKYLIRVLRFEKSKSEEVFLASWALSSFLLSVTLVLFSKVLVNATGIRYLAVPWMGLVATALALYAPSPAHTLSSLRRIPFIPGLAVCIGLSVAVLGSYYHFYKPPAKLAQRISVNRELGRIAKKVLRMGLDRGFATYWNSIVLQNFIDNGEIEVCPISFSDERIGPFEWLVSENCFKRAHNQPMNFLILTRKEAGQIMTNSKLSCVYKKVTSKFYEGGFEIWIYKPRLNVRELCE